MKINKVAVEYKELRSSGYPNYSNTTYGVAYESIVEDNETPEDVRRSLLEKAIKDVRFLHGDKFEGYQIKIIKEQSTPNQIPF